MKPHQDAITRARQAGRHRGIEIAGHVFYVQTTLSVTTEPTVVSELFHSGRVLRVFRTPFPQESLADVTEIQAAVAASQETAEQFVRERFAQLETAKSDVERAGPGGEEAEVETHSHLERAEQLARRFGQWRRPRGEALFEGELLARPRPAGVVSDRSENEALPQFSKAVELEVLGLYADLRETPLDSLETRRPEDLQETADRIGATLGRMDVLIRTLDGVGSMGLPPVRTGAERLALGPHAALSGTMIIEAVNTAIRALEGLILLHVPNEAAVRPIRDRLDKQLEGSLILRRAFANFRQAVSSSTGSKDLEIRLRYTANALATLLGSSAHRWLRMKDRMLLLDLQYRLRRALAEACSKDSADELWRDIESTVEILSRVNHRAELKNRDRRFVALLPAELPVPQSKEFLGLLRQFYGLHADLDREIVTGAEISAQVYSEFRDAVVLIG